jgi:hypothetical protein
MSLKSYELGTELVLTTTFVDPATKLAAQPDAVVCRLQGPDRVEHDIPVSNPATGLYKASYTPLIPGVWTVRWAGSGRVAAAVEYKFEVRPSVFQ